MSSLHSVPLTLHYSNSSLYLSPEVIRQVSKNCDSLLSLALPAAFWQQDHLVFPFVARVVLSIWALGVYYWVLGALTLLADVIRTKLFLAKSNAGP